MWVLCAYSNTKALNETDKKLDKNDNSELKKPWKQRANKAGTKVNKISLYPKKNKAATSKNVEGIAFYYPELIVKMIKLNFRLYFTV